MDNQDQPVSTTCNTCGRSMWSNHLDAVGNCNGCEGSSSKMEPATEEEWVDLGRPTDNKG